MDEKLLEYFRVKLLQKQLSLIDMVHRTEGYGREKDRNILDIGDMAVQSYTKEFLFGKSNADRQILQMIVEALDRIENETFGYCTHCENPIPPKRLEAVPWAGYCIDCQGLMEKGLLE
ncbi:MAG: TraR/DksA family transcriptional regulator [Acidobacteriota bacterium]|jgi:DnaK suppressor protein